MKKTYWQAMDRDGKMYAFNGKPTLEKGCFYLLSGGDCSMVVAFPIPLKPLQIATITVNENGTWSYEIEREEGWYCAKSKANGKYHYLKYKNYCWFGVGGGGATADLYTISSTRIPDECVI